MTEKDGRAGISTWIDLISCCGCGCFGLVGFGVWWVVGCLVGWFWLGVLQVDWCLAWWERGGDVGWELVCE